MECSKCNKVSKIMAVEVELIKKHIDKHKEYNHILSDDEAIIDFVNKFAWIMREVVCEFCQNKTCKELKLSESLPDIDDLSLLTMIHKCESDEDITEIELHIIKRHITDHKWYNNIPTYSAAISDFLKKYSWIIKELGKARSKIL